MFRFLLGLMILAAGILPANAQWFQQTSNTTWPLFGVNASNPQTATAAGDVSMIRHTTDAGQTWITQTGEPGQVFTAVSFCDDSNGTIAGPNGLTVYTHNGGTLWQTAQVGMIVWYYAAMQLSPQWAIVGGQNTIFQPIVTITTNGWQSFDSHVFYPFHDGSNHEGIVNGVDFTTTEIGCAALSIDLGGGAICRTPDGGTEWETVYWGNSALYGIDFPISDAGLVGYAVGYGGTFVHTTDGGLTWEELPTPTTQPLNGVSFPTQLDGWAVGDAGTIIHTSNGGQSWQTQDSPVTDDLYSVSFANADTGYATGNNGVIIFTGNGGQSANQPPGEFWREWPHDSTWVIGGIWGIMNWTRAADGNGDTLSYILHIWSPDNPLWQDSTFVLVDTQRVVNIPAPHYPDTLHTMYWTVHATDGQDTTNAANGTGVFFVYQEVRADDPFILHPSSFSLSAYPNPFNPATTLNLSLPVSTEAVLKVFDITGRLAREIALGRLEAGIHAIPFDGSDLPSGIYLVEFQTSQIRLTKKLVLLK